MQFQKIWLIITLLCLAACADLSTPAIEENNPKTPLTLSTPTQAVLLSPTSQPSLPTPLGSPSPLPSAVMPMTQTVVAATPASSTISSQSDAEPVLIYQRSGGFAGISETWRVYPDGRVATTGQQWQVTPEEVEQLLEEIEAAGFFDLESEYMPKNTCCDRFTHQLRVEWDGKIQTLTTMDATPGAPAAVQETLSLVNDFFNSSAPN